MRIGIDATCWANERGYGRFTRELVSAMAPLAPAHEFICFLDARAASHFSLQGPNIVPVVVRQSVSPTVAAATGGRRSLTDMLALTHAVRHARLDVFFCPSVYGFFPLPPKLPSVVTVHDAIAERFPSLTLPALTDRLFWRAKVWLALRQAHCVLTVSQYAAAQVNRYLGVPTEKMRVTLEGVAPAFRPSDSEQDIRAAAANRGLRSDARWFLYVGGFGPHKHVDGLVRAHARVVSRHPDPALMLLLVGPQTDVFHQDIPRIQNAIRECGTDSRVRWLGYVPDEELRHFHSGALALVLPSASEGFGLPAVEAAACGTPVIATTESPLPTILDGGGIFVAPGDEQALEQALEQMMSDEEQRRALGRRALEKARELSWSRSARIALDALEDAAGRK